MTTRGSGAYVGQALRTIEGRAPVTGSARYTADFRFDGQAYVHIVRSPHAAATIRRVDLDAAHRVAGVIDAIDGAIAAAISNPIPHYIDAAVFGGKTTDVRPLALDQVVYYGQPVAAVLAEDPATARDAAERIKVDYEPLPAVVEIEDALADGARSVVPGWDDNTIMQVPFQNGDFEAAAEQADRVVATRVRIHRFSTQPIETRGYNAVWDAQNQGITLYATAQNPHPLRHVLANTLRLPENRIRIV
ncbi:MAG: molybdopterin cofactor-binding domain-containing protein, partial [Pseudomonadota bacterium]